MPEMPNTPTLRDGTYILWHSQWVRIVDCYGCRFPTQYGGSTIGECEFCYLERLSRDARLDAGFPTA